MTQIPQLGTKQRSVTAKLHYSSTRELYALAWQDGRRLGVHGCRPHGPRKRGGPPRVPALFLNSSNSYSYHVDR
jgi:hypothetical protein